MTIEKVLPVKIEVDDNDPKICDRDDCPYYDYDGFFCNRYQIDISPKSHKRCRQCIKDFGIPTAQTDLDYANRLLQTANNTIANLRESALEQYERAENLLAANKELGEINMKLAEAHNAATRFVFVDASPQVGTRCLLPTTPCCDPTILCRSFPCTVYGKVVAFHVKHGTTIYCDECAFRLECPRTDDVKKAKVSHFTEVDPKTGQPE